MPLHQDIRDIVPRIVPHAELLVAQDLIGVCDPLEALLSSAPLIGRLLVWVCQQWAEWRSIRQRGACVQKATVAGVVWGTVSSGAVYSRAGRGGSSRHSTVFHRQVVIRLLNLLG